jgi:DNA-binding CsgD family transcriptional regulator
MADKEEGLNKSKDVSEEDSLLQPGMLSPKDELHLDSYNQLITKGFLSSLTHNEYQVWRLFANTRLSSELISQELNLSLNSVRNYINRVVRKLRLELTVNKDWSYQDEQKYTSNGFKKNLKTLERQLDSTDKARKIDKMFKERLRKHKREVDAFLKKHPLIRYKLDQFNDEANPNEDN